MRRFLLVFAAILCCLSLPAQTYRPHVSAIMAMQSGITAPAHTTWYVRLDGGTATQSTGLCNAPYPGSGTGTCSAVNHLYWLLNQSTFAWRIAGGDTVQYEDYGPYYHGKPLNGLGQAWPWCTTTGGTDGCHPPPPPNGSAGNPTRILGKNAGACHNSAHTLLLNPTVIEGTDGVNSIFDLHASNNVDLECMELTQPDTCVRVNGGVTGSCIQDKNNFAKVGIIMQLNTGQGPANFTLADLAIVGLAEEGINGSHYNLTAGDVSSASDLYIEGNGMGGWDADAGGCNASCETVGTLNISHIDVSWNGCNAVKPYNLSVPPVQNAYNYCNDDSAWGYGDGFVLIAMGDATINIDSSFFRYNTQDGFDGLHQGDDLTHNPHIHITNSWSEGNEGATFKTGAGGDSSAENNVSIANCRFLGTASNAPLNPAGWNANLHDLCRAAGDEWSFSMKEGQTLTLANNTSVGYGTTMYDTGCKSGSCPTTKIIFKNNINKGYPDAANFNQLASGFYFETGIGSANITATNNLWSTMRTGCPDNTLTGETGLQCGDPLLAAESNIDAINPHLMAGSPAIGAGVAVAGLSTDYAGNPRPAPPSIGAFELVGASAPPPPPPVVQAVPVITWAPASLVVTSALSSAQLNATAPTPGVFTYTPALGTYLPIGTATLSVTFAPTDTVNFKAAAKTATVVVTAPKMGSVNYVCAVSVVNGVIVPVCGTP